MLSFNKTKHLVIRERALYAIYASEMRTKRKHGHIKFYSGTNRIINNENLISKRI